MALLSRVRATYHPPYFSKGFSYFCRISRSEYATTSHNGQASTQSLPCVSMYRVSDLVCEGSELCFEELRAQRYFDKCQQKKQLREMGTQSPAFPNSLLYPSCSDQYLKVD